MHACMHACVCMHARAHAHACTHTHTHTHTDLDEDPSISCSNYFVRVGVEERGKNVVTWEIEYTS
jgi:hypothetical protein